MQARASTLRLPLRISKASEPALEQGFKRAELPGVAKIFDDQSSPMPQLIPLSAICAHLADRTTQHGVKQKLLRWVLERCARRTVRRSRETRFGMDIRMWLHGPKAAAANRARSAMPTSHRWASSPLRAASLRLPAALVAFNYKHGGRDFASGTPIDLNTYFNNAIDIHHVFPRAPGVKSKPPPRKSGTAWSYHKAPLAAGTNRFINSGAMLPPASTSPVSRRLRFPTVSMSS